MKSLSRALALVLTLVLSFGPTLAFAQLTPPVTPPVTPPADTTPPVISGVATGTTLPTGATLVWTTNELATFTFAYGTTQNYGSSAAISGGAALAGTAVLTGLAPGTLYYYCIHATDTSGNASQSCSSFTTAAAPDITAPIVSVVIAVATTTAATITWTTSENADAQVEYGTTASYGSTSNLNSTLGLTHSVELSSLSPNTTYHYRVLSHDAAGNLATGSDNTFTTSALPSVSAPVTITDTIPPVITDVSSVSLEPHDANIIWTTDELATSQLEYGTTMSYGSTATLPTDALLSHSATLLNLQANTKYYYCIHATDLFNNTASSCSSSNTFTTTVQQVNLDTIPPTISLVTVAPITTTTAGVTWTTDEVGNGYIQYGTTNGYGSETQLNTALTLMHNASVSGLAPNTTYHYRVISSDEAGNVSMTPDETFTTAAPIAPADTTPPTITNIVQGSIGSTNTVIDWTTNEPAISTLEYGTTTSYGSTGTLSTSALLTHSATILNLAPGTTYYYCIHATDLAGNTANSCSQSFTTESAPVVTPPVVVPPQIIPPSAPQSNIVAAVISSVGADSLSQTGATITWTTNVPSDSRVEYGDNMEFDQTASDATLAISHSVMLTGLDSDTNYDFRVVSKPAGTGAVETTSNVYDFNTLAVPVVIDPAANILSVTTGSVSATNASVSWTTDEATIVSLEYGLSSAYGLTAVASTSIQTSGTMALSNLIPSTIYHYRVKAIDAADNITYSEDHTFTTSASLSEPTSTSTIQVASTTVESSQSAPIVLTSSGGGGSGGSFSSLPTPALITAASVDSQIVFMWNNSESGNVTGTIIIRKEGIYPGSPQDGQVIYQGNATTFSDTNLQNGKTYYYTAYSYAAGGQYSNPIHIATSPAAGVTQVQLDENSVLEPALANDHFGADLKLGDKNLEVEHLQQILNTVNVHPSGLTTGYFGPLTVSALKTFQAKYQLPQTGIADAATRAVLSSLSQSWMIPNAPNGLADLQTDLKRGDTGQDVSDLQTFLDYEGSYEEGIISGTYGPLTQESVADFQTKHGVTPVSGYVGYKTRHTIQTVLGL